MITLDILCATSRGYFGLHAGPERDPLWPSDQRDSRTLRRRFDDGPALETGGNMPAPIRARDPVRRPGILRPRLAQLEARQRLLVLPGRLGDAHERCPG